MEFIIIGVVSALNLILIVHKFKKGRVEDGIFDSVLFTILAMLFSGSYGGMVVAMIASLVVSIYLWSSPPKFFRSFVNSKEVKSIVSELKDFDKLKRPYKKKRKNSDEVNFD